MLLFGPVLLLSLLHPMLGFLVDWKKVEKIARGRVEVKTFINEDLPLYHNCEMKYIPGADPELVILDEQYQELQRYPLGAMKRKEIIQLMKSLGFYKKESIDAPVPAEFQTAPLRKPQDAKDDL